MARRSTARPADEKKRRFRLRTLLSPGADTRNAAPQRQICGSKGTNRKITQPQIGKAPPLPQSEQRPIERLSQQIVTASHCNSDAFAEKSALKVWSAPEDAAVARIRAVKPEGERHTVAKKEIDLTSLQRESRSVRIWIKTQLGFREEGLEIGFMGSACDNPDFFPFESFRANVFDRTVAARHKSCRGAVIGIAEIEPRAHLGRRRDRGNNGIAVLAVARSDQCIELTHLHRARDLKLFANQPGKIHIEPYRCTVRPGIIERRIVGFGKEADDADAGKVGTLRPPPRIPEAWDRHGLDRLCRWRGRGGRWSFGGLRKRCHRGKYGQCYGNSQDPSATPTQT